MADRSNVQKSTLSASRRAFLAGMGAAAGPLILPGRAFGRVQAGRRVNVAVIGAGGMGANNMAKLVSQNIVAACDVDFEHVDASLRDRQGKLRPEMEALHAAYAAAPRYADWRRMFDQRKDIEAVVIATPDHHHAVAARAAMERGIHVYVQKPLTYTVREGRVLLDLAQRNPKLVTQMGNQGHSGDDGRRVVEIVRSGLLGKVREVHVWTNRPVWPQGVARGPAQTPPDSLDWDLWRGPAPVDWGYNPDYAHFNWRGWVPFGTGALGDMGAHLIDFPVWALELGLPTRIETRSSRWGGDDNIWDGKPPAQLSSYPLASVTHYEFGRAPGGPVKLVWYDGGLMPPTPEGWPADVAMDPDGGVLYVGKRGKLIHGTYGEKFSLIGDGLAEKAERLPVKLPRIRDGIAGHEMNWIRAIRGEEAASCPFSFAVPLTEAMLMGIVALRAGKPILYDGNRVTNDEAANQFLDREYRAGWGI